MTELEINERTMQKLGIYRDLKRDGYRHQRDIRAEYCTCCGKRSLRTEHWEKRANGRQFTYLLRACRDCGYIGI